MRWLWLAVFVASEKNPILNQLHVSREHSKRGTDHFFSDTQIGFWDNIANRSRRYLILILILNFPPFLQENGLQTVGIDDDRSIVRECKRQIPSRSKSIGGKCGPSLQEIVESPAVGGDKVVGDSD